MLVITNAVSARMTSCRFGAVLFEQVPVAIDHLQHSNGFMRTPWFGNTDVGARHLEQRAVAGAERNRQVGREVLLRTRSASRRSAPCLGPSISIILIAGMLRDCSSARRSVTGPSNL